MWEKVNSIFFIFIVENKDEKSKSKILLMQNVKYFLLKHQTKSYILICTQHYTRQSEGVRQIKTGSTHDSWSGSTKDTSCSSRLSAATHRKLASCTAQTKVMFQLLFLCTERGNRAALHYNHTHTHGLPLCWWWCFSVKEQTSAKDGPVYSLMRMDDMHIMCFPLVPCEALM